MAKSAIIIGDLQVGITGNYPFARDLVPRAADLAATARTLGDLVVFVRTRLRRNGSDVSPNNGGVRAIFEMNDDFHDGSRGVQLDEGLGFRDSDVLVTKRRASAFAGTDLDMVLRGSGIESVVIAGVATRAMVAATVYDAADRDYIVRVVSDVCADPVPAVHEFFLGTVFPGNGVEVLNSADIGSGPS